MSTRCQRECSRRPQATGDDLHRSETGLPLLARQRCRRRSDDRTLAARCRTFGGNCNR